MAIEVCNRRRRIRFCDWRRRIEACDWRGRRRDGGSHSLFNGHDRRGLFHRASQGSLLFGSAHGALGGSGMMQTAPERGSDHDNCHRSILHGHISLYAHRPTSGTRYTHFIEPFELKTHPHNAGANEDIFRFRLFFIYQPVAKYSACLITRSESANNRTGARAPKTGCGHWSDLPPPIHRAEISWVHGRGRNRNLD
jgi:hypothetical protein